MKVHKYQKVFCESYEMEGKKQRNDGDAVSTWIKT